MVIIYKKYYKSIILIIILSLSTDLIIKYKIKNNFSNLFLMFDYI